MHTLSVLCGCEFCAIISSFCFSTFSFIVLPVKVDLCYVDAIQIGTIQVISPTTTKNGYFLRTLDSSYASSAEKLYGLACYLGWLIRGLVAAPLFTPNVQIAFKFLVGNVYVCGFAIIRVLNFVYNSNVSSASCLSSVRARQSSSLSERKN